MKKSLFLSSIIDSMVLNQKSLLQQYINYIFGIEFQGDGTEEVIACSWDGQTYIVNLQKEVVRFHFRENVAAFCAGMMMISVVAMIESSSMIVIK